MNDTPFSFFGASELSSVFVIFMTVFHFDPVKGSEKI